MKKRNNLKIGKTGFMLSLVLFILIVLYISVTPLFEGVKGGSLTIAASSLCSDAGGLCIASCPDGYEEETSLSPDCSTDLPYCGDDYCDFDEDCSICESDCGTCELVCDDGTPYYFCSADLTKYCQDGSLIDNCVAGCPVCSGSDVCDSTTGRCISGGAGNVTLRCGDSICSPEIGEDCDSCSFDCLSSGQICCSGESRTPTCTTGSCPSGQTCGNPGTCTSYCYTQGSPGASPILAKSTLDPGTAGAILQVPSLKCCIPKEPKPQKTVISQGEFTDSDKGDRFVTETGEIRYVVDLTTSNRRILTYVEPTAIIEVISSATGTTQSYVITILEKTENAITLSLGTLPININKGETKQIDLDNNGKIDLLITVDEITDTIDFTFENYIIPSSGKEEERIVGGIQQQEPGFEQKYFKKILLVMIIVLAGIIVTLVVKENMPKRGSPQQEYHKKELEKILGKADTGLRRGRFDSALQSYAMINNLANKIPKNQLSTKLETEIMKITAALNLYLKISQAHALAKTKNFPQLRETLSQIHELKESLINDYPESSSLFEYASQQHEHFLRKHHEHVIKKNFFQELARVNSLVNEKRKQEALKQYRALKKYYAPLSQMYNYETRNYFYMQMVDAYQRILRIGQSNITLPILQKIPTKKEKPSTKPHFSKLRTFLKQNEYGKALDLYKEMYS